MHTDDPIRDFERHFEEQEKELENLPICAECGEPIQDDMCYEIDGKYICDECMDNHRVYTPDFNR